MRKSITYIVAIYSDNCDSMVKPLRVVFSQVKADYFCNYYESKLSLTKNQFIGWDIY